MTPLHERIETVLLEARMLLLGGQVLLGFSYRICFEQGFERIPAAARLAQVSALVIMTAALAWLISPAAFHQIAERGFETPRVERFTHTVLNSTLAPFAIGLGLSFYPVSSALHLPQPAWIGVAATAFALAIWYGSTLKRRVVKQQRPAQLERAQKPQQKEEKPDISSRIKKVLLECRMAAPGAQAFLGFQFAIVFTEGFERLPRSSQMVHFGSLLATTISIVLLIAPAPYHRLVEHGNETERFLRVSSRFLITALVFLAPGMAGDLLVVLRKVTGNEAISSGISALLLLACYGLWFGVSLWKRQTRR
jgi:hypothetical protein